MTCPHGTPNRWRCTRCTATYMQGYMHRYRRRDPRHLERLASNWLQAAILSHLAEAPAPVGATALVALTGCRDVLNLRAAIYRARRAGHPIRSVAAGRTVRYRLALEEA